MCGIVGVYNVDKACKTAIAALLLLQHRGQDAAGVAVAKPDGTIKPHRKEGKILEAFRKKKSRNIPGRSAIAHTRYATTGDADERSMQPILVEFVPDGEIAFAHNGNDPLYRQMQEQLRGYYQTDTDTEGFPRRMEQLQGDNLTLEKRLLLAASTFTGSYALVALTPERLYALRDPAGNRPLVIARKDEGFIVSSETIGLERKLGARIIREVNPGEMVVFEGRGEMRSVRIPRVVEREGFCQFEWAYFANPASTFLGTHVSVARRRAGQILYEEELAHVHADAVVPVVDSGIQGSVGYSIRSGIPYEANLVRDHHATRSFIMPNQDDRVQAVIDKLIPLEPFIKDRRWIIYDDSLVRGNTARTLNRELRNLGLKEAHWRIGYPVVTHPCEYGIAMKHKELIAPLYGNDVDSIRKDIEADSLQFISQEGHNTSVGIENPDRKLCTYCTTGCRPQI